MDDAKRPYVPPDFVREYDLTAEELQIFRGFAELDAEALERRIDELDGQGKVSLAELGRCELQRLLNAAVVS